VARIAGGDPGEGEVAREALRGSLLRIDRSIVSLIAARMNISDLLGEVKKREGLPVYDPSREVSVANLLAEEASRLGLPAGLVKEIYFLIARESRCRQLYCPVQARIAVYGTGGMGRMIAGLLARAGCWTAITGRTPEKVVEASRATGAKAMEPGEALDWADMLVYAVPTGATVELLGRHWSSYRESMLIADIASVKAPVVRAVERLYRERGGGPEYASLHPLFGPLGCPAGETVAVVPVRLERWRERLEKLLTGLGLVHVYVDWETHDKAMAVNQVLHHLAVEALAEAMERLRERLGLDPGVVKSLATYSLRQTLSVASRLERLRGVVEEIRRENPYAREAVETLLEVLGEKAREATGGEG